MNVGFVEREGWRGGEYGSGKGVWTSVVSRRQDGEERVLEGWEHINCSGGAARKGFMV